jgi:MFS family permease
MTTPLLGLRANWRQFWLLVLVNAFVGAMVGLERTVLPLLASQDFGLASRSAALSFIVTFGLVKAVTNLVAGRMGDRFGRKRVLVAGWLFALPVAPMVIWAPSWAWIVAANVLLGINQGLAWSTTVVMKIDLVGPARRGFAMGLNEFAGYLALALSALASGEIASRDALRPGPFYLGIAFAIMGLVLSLFFVRETLGHVRHEVALREAALPISTLGDMAPTLRDIIVRTSWRDPALFNATQAGFVNNVNDGLAWGLFPLYFAAAGLSVHEIAMLAFIYPATWGIAQLGAGGLSDRVGRKWLVAGGMLLQGTALLLMIVVHGLGPWLATSALLGLGTAMVYPTLLAVVGDVARPSWRASAVGVYRFWRDSGYAIGALLAGTLADAFGMETAVVVIGVLTLLSGLQAAIRMPETLATSPLGAPQPSGTLSARMRHPL